MSGDGHVCTDLVRVALKVCEHHSQSTRQVDYCVADFNAVQLTLGFSNDHSLMLW